MQLLKNTTQSTTSSFNLFGKQTLLVLLVLLMVGPIQSVYVSPDLQIYWYLKFKEVDSLPEFPKPSWKDFGGLPNYEWDYDAYCSWKITYQYHVDFSETRPHVVLDVNAFLDRNNSWVKPGKQTQELLEHEQGHYYIGCLAALTFKKRVSQANLSPDNYKEQIDGIFEDTLREFLKLEEIYDGETNHFWNKEAQRKWNHNLTSDINALREYWGN